MIIHKIPEVTFKEFINHFSLTICLGMVESDLGWGCLSLPKQFPKVASKLGIPIVNNNFGEPMELKDIFNIAINDLTSFVLWWNSNEVGIFG